MRISVHLLLNARRHWHGINSHHHNQNVNSDNSCTENTAIILQLYMIRANLLACYCSSMYVDTKYKFHLHACHTTPLYFKVLFRCLYYHRSMFGCLYYHRSMLPLGLFILPSLHVACRAVYTTIAPCCM